jgi:hypothetical protein
MADIFSIFLVEKRQEKRMNWKDQEAITVEPQETSCVGNVPHHMQAALPEDIVGEIKNRARDGE